jgi:hypothetical protein
MILHYFPGTPAWLRTVTDLVLVLHIAGGATGVLAGAAALTFRKGETWHRRAGTAFVIGMLALGTTAVWIGVVMNEMGNIFGGLFVCYTVSTAWMTVRRPAGQVGRFEWIAMLAAFTAAAGTGFGAVQRAQAHHFGPLFVAATIMTLVAAGAGAGDLSMILRRGLSGPQRVARHLWRMCLGFFMAAAAFVTQPSMFPMPSPYLFALACLPLALMIFWLLRVGFTSQFKREEPLAARSVI